MPRIQANARVISAFAYQHLRAAALFRDQVVVLETQNLARPLGEFFTDVRSYTSACILSAAAALEAFINELFMTPEGQLRPMLKNFETDFWGLKGIERKQPLAKYQLALTMLSKAKLDSQNNCYRDTWALFEMRNSLIHFKPSWDPDRHRTIDLVDALTGKYELSPFVDAGANFITMRSMSAGCTTWVIRTVLEFLHEFQNRAEIDENRMAAFWQIKSH